MARPMLRIRPAPVTTATLPSSPVSTASPIGRPLRCLCAPAWGACRRGRVTPRANEDILYSLDIPVIAPSDLTP